MKWITGPPGWGKTYTAVQIANETGAYLVVRSRKHARLCQQEYGANRLPITYDELIAGRMLGSFVRNVVIDDVDALLEYICSGLKIEAVTLSHEIEQLPRPPRLPKAALPKPEGA